MIRIHTENGSTYGGMQIKGSMEEIMTDIAVIYSYTAKGLCKNEKEFNAFKNVMVELLQSIDYEDLAHCNIEWRKNNDEVSDD